VKRAVVPAPGTETNPFTTPSQVPDTTIAFRAGKSLTKNFPRRGKVRTALRTLQLFHLSFERPLTDLFPSEVCSRVAE